jgi:hypothetical protein
VRGRTRWVWRPSAASSACYGLSRLWAGADSTGVSSTAPIAGAQGTGLPANHALVPAGPSQAEFPPPALMPHFIELFFKYNSQSLPFLSYESVVTSFLCSTLSPLLSNAIASIAAK